MSHRFFRFEHRREKVAQLSKFLARLGRYGAFSLALICISLLIGIAGYHHYQELSWIDSFYMASMILTGMGPIAEMTTESAKIFSSIYALYSGVAFLSITAIFFAPIIHRLLHVLHVESDEK
jgi:hypothetical protein